MQRDMKRIPGAELQELIRISEHPDHKAIRQRTDERFRALKESRRLYENHVPVQSK